MKDRYRSKIFFIFGVLGAIIPSLWLINLQQDCIDRWKEREKKDRGLFLLMNQWTRLKQDGKNLENFFKKNGYKRIAIYGMSYVGLSLVKELSHSEIEIVYGIDRNADNIYSNVKLITMEDKLLCVDAIVVTAISGYDEIRDALSEKVECPIISIEDILNAL